MTFDDLHTILVQGPNGPLDTVKPASVEDMTSHTLVSVHRDNNYVGLAFSNGGVMFLYHPQEADEVVELQSIKTPFSTILLSPLTSFKERYAEGVSMGNPPSYTCEQYTYHDIVTEKGKTTLIWYGYSNNVGWEQAVHDVCLPKTPLSAHQRMAIITAATHYHKPGCSHA